MASRQRGSRGHVEKLPSGRIRATVFVGTAPLTGEWRCAKKTHPTEAAAGIALTKLQRSVDQDNHPKTAITARRAIEQWREVAELQETTRERYEDLISIHVTPTFGDLQASKWSGLLDRAIDMYTNEMIFRPDRTTP